VLLTGAISESVSHVPPSLPSSLSSSFAQCLTFIDDEDKLLNRAPLLHQ
jgi:hypothetical protein